MFAKLLHWIGWRAPIRGGLLKQKLTPVIIPRSEHTLTRRFISTQALKVLYRLHDAGFQAFLVGGGVRDVLLGQHPKDFDVATNAHPEEVAALFRNSRMIGRRFRLIHVHFGNHIVEVATFRAGLTDVEQQGQDGNIVRHAEDGMILRDNIYGTLEQDVWRRDFTVNALYYNIADYSLLDYVGGLKDLNAKILRLIGDPELRYREDPVRMLRAIRFAAKLNFKLHPNTEKPIYQLATLISNVPSARIFDEYLKLFLSGFSLNSFQLLQKYGFFKMLFPETHHLLTSNKYPWFINFITLCLKNTDQRILENKSVTPIFLLATFLWYPILAEMEALQAEHSISLFQALHEAVDKILHSQQNAFAIPRRMTQFLKEIWVLQLRMQMRQKNRIRQIETHPRFRAAFDFLVLRKEAGEPIESVANWWIEYEHADESQKLKLLNSLGDRKRRKRHKKYRKSSSKVQDSDPGNHSSASL